MIKYLNIILSFLILFSSISFAADQYHPAINKKSKKQHEQNNTASDPCESTSGLGQQECAQKKMNIADKKLNAVYKVLLLKLPEVEGTVGGETGRYPKHGLIAAQRAWIKYRDANCEFFGDMYGEAPVWRLAENLNCQVKMTESRTKELQKYLKDYN